MASFNVPCPKASSLSSEKQRCTVFIPSSGFRLNRRSMLPQLQLSCSRSRSNVFKLCAQLNEAAVEKASNAAPAHKTAAVKELKSQHEIPDAASISAFMDQVSDLIELVDSRDITELQLKQTDCELLIRKKEALQQSSPAAPVFYTPPTQQTMYPPQLPPMNVPPPTSVGSTESAPTSAPMLPAPAKPKSSHPLLKCPMAGNFYCSPAPGAPPFVKVGDKVKKGQILCIIEAMKLMNEIEADQDGTIVEILVDDGKPVSVDMPLFIIEP
ncbi:Acetyl-CoA carboxylase [Handroanthus impetiginosus]|uniref:Biotin carboxyl carrier protein of acetyl-CoA carboxylase n=1 Tax=Handroanthus impetiginosus TaxID=429701 RepID=A0A2G9HII4_9LAMI|nr:Acetyl-CoA carboxylase [Handroanthus impetiginosus]